MEKATVQSIDRALSIIEALAGEKEGLGVTEISTRVGLHKSTVHRLLSALGERGYVEQRSGGAYRLGMKIVELSSLYLNQVELKTEAQPYLRRLLQLTKQPVHLSMLDGLEIVYIDKIETIHSIRMYSQIGRRSPALCTASGKALLSGLPDAELCERIRSTTDPEALIKEVRLTRQRGWSRDDQEHEPGIRCIAAPIYDYRGNIIAAVSTAGLKQIITPARDEEIAGFVMDAALSISRRMGYRD